MGEKSVKTSIRPESTDLKTKGSVEIGVIGIGMGGDGHLGMTVAAEQFCREADLLIGAKRMLAAVSLEGQETYDAYLTEDILSCLDRAGADPENKIRRAAVLLSGDVGFYSGAKKLLDRLPEETRVYPGISSVVYFCSQLHMSWDDVRLTSIHGRTCNLLWEILTHKKVFSILGDKDAVKMLCRKLCDYAGGWLDTAALTVHVGENLSYPDERIITGSPESFLSFDGKSSLQVVLVENKNPRTVCTHGIPDEEFLRDRVPMTKEEVREVSLSKLRLTSESVVYDVGAGSGSVSIEAAMQAGEGHVYAIEKNPDAVSLLHRNRKKFCADHMDIISGCAPEALAALPVPTHVFLGGSSGNMREILEAVLAKNPAVRVVVNAITLETVGEALSCLQDLGFCHLDVVSVSAAKAKTAGKYHLMMGLNPVYILSADGPDTEKEKKRG